MNAFIDIELMSVDILNAYIMAPVKEKVCTTLSANFGKNAKNKTMHIQFLMISKY